MSKSFFKRAMSGFLAALIMIGSWSGIPLSVAATPGGFTPIPDSVSPVPDGVTAVPDYFTSTPDFGTLEYGSVSPAPDSIPPAPSGNETYIIGGERFKVLDNGYLSCYISMDDGSFTVLPTSEPFDPFKPRSYASFRIDGEEFAFGTQRGTFIAPCVDENGIAESVWQIDGYVVGQYLAITEDTSHTNSYAVKVAYAVEYFEGDSSSVSARILVDTLAGTDDSAPLVFSDETGTHSVSAECTIAPVPAALSVEEGTGAKAFFVNHDRENAAAVTAAVAADFGLLAAAVYDHAQTDLRSFSEIDTAVALYYEEQNMAVATAENPAQSLAVFSTNYGYYDLSYAEFPATQRTVEDVILNPFEDDALPITLETDDRIILATLPTSAIPGDTVSFMPLVIDPEAMELSIVALVVGGDHQPLTPDGSGLYSFVMPTESFYLTVRGTFKPGWMPIQTLFSSTQPGDLNSFGNWGLTPDRNYIKAGESATLTVDLYYGIAYTVSAEYFDVDNAPQTLALAQTDNTYTFTAPADGASITLSIEIPSPTFYNISCVTAPSGQGYFSVSTISNGVLRAAAGDLVYITDLQTFDPAVYSLATAKILVNSIETGTTLFTLNDLTLPSLHFTMPSEDVAVRLELKECYPITVTAYDADTGSPMGNSENVTYTLSPAVPEAGEEVTVYFNMFGGLIFEGTCHAQGVYQPVVTPLADGTGVTFIAPDAAVTLTPFFTIPPVKPVLYPITLEPLMGDGVLQFGLGISTVRGVSFAAEGDIVSWHYFEGSDYSPDWELKRIYYRYTDNTGTEHIEELTPDHLGFGLISPMPPYPITIAIEGGKYPKQIQTQAVCLDAQGNETPLLLPYNTVTIGVPVSGTNMFTCSWNEITLMNEAAYGSYFYIWANSRTGYQLERIVVVENETGKLLHPSDNQIVPNYTIGSNVYGAYTVGTNDVTVKAYYTVINPVAYRVTGYESATDLQVTRNIVLPVNATGAEGGKLYYSVTLSYPTNGATEYSLADMPGLTLNSSPAHLGYKLYTYEASYTGQSEVVFTVAAKTLPQLFNIEAFTVNHTYLPDFNRIDVYGSGFKDTANALSQIESIELSYMALKSSTADMDMHVSTTVAVDTKYLTVVTDKYMTIDMSWLAGDQKSIHFPHRLHISWLGYAGLQGWGKGLGFTYYLYNNAINLSTPGYDPETGERLPAPLLTHIGVMQMKGTNQYQLIVGSSDTVLILNPERHSRMLTSFSCSDGFTVSTNGSTLPANEGSAPVLLGNGLVIERLDTDSTFTIVQHNANSMTVTAKGCALKANSLCLYTPTPLGDTFSMTINNRDYLLNAEDALKMTNPGVYDNSARQLIIALNGYSATIDIPGMGGIGAQYTGVGLLENAVFLQGEAYVKLPDTIAENPLAGIDIQALVFAMDKTPIGFDGLIASGGFDTTPFLIFDVGGRAYALIDTFNDRYEFEVDAKLKAVEFSGVLHLKKSERLSSLNGGNPIVMLDRFEFGLNSPIQGIPLIPIAPVGELNGVSGGIYNIVDTLDFDLKVNTIPALKVYAGAKFTLVELMDLDVKLEVGFASMKMSFSGGFTLSGTYNLEILEEYTAEIGFRDAAPVGSTKRVEYYHAIRLKLDLIKGIVSFMEAGGEVKLSAVFTSPDTFLKTYDNPAQMFRDVRLTLSLYGKLYALVHVPQFSIGPFNFPRISLPGVQVEFLGTTSMAQFNLGKLKMNASVTFTARIFGSVRAKLKYNTNQPYRVNAEFHLLADDAQEGPAALYEDTAKVNGAYVTTTIGEGFSVVADTDPNVVVPVPLSAAQSLAPLAADPPTISITDAGRTHTVRIPDDGKVYLLALRSNPADLRVYGPGGAPVALQFMPTGSVAPSSVASYNAVVSADGQGVILSLTAPGEWIVTSGEVLRTSIVSGAPGADVADVKLAGGDIRFRLENLDTAKRYAYSIILEQRANPDAPATDCVILQTTEITPPTTDYNGTYTLDIPVLAETLPTGTYYPSVSLYELISIPDADETLDLVASAPGYEVFAHTNTKYAANITAENVQVTAGGNETIRLRFTHNDAKKPAGTEVAYAVRIFNETTGLQTTDAQGTAVDYSVPLPAAGTVDVLYSVPGAGSYRLELIPLFSTSGSTTVAGHGQTINVTNQGVSISKNVTVAAAVPPVLTLSVQNGRRSIDGKSIFGRSNMVVTVETDTSCDIAITPYAGTYSIQNVYQKPIPLAATTAPAQTLALDCEPADDVNGRLLTVTATNPATGDQTTEYVTLYLDDIPPVLILEDVESGIVLTASDGSFSVTGRTEPNLNVAGSLGSMTQADAFGYFTLTGQSPAANTQLIISVSDEAGNSALATTSIVNAGAVLAIAFEQASGKTTLTKGDTLVLAILGTLSSPAPGGVSTLKIPQNLIAYTVTSGVNAVSVDSNGIMTALAAGDAAVTATFTNGTQKLTAVLYVTVTDPDDTDDGGGTPGINDGSGGGGGVLVPTAPIETTAPADEEAVPKKEPTTPSYRTKSYVKGYPDGTFRPDANISRAEVIQLLYNLLGSPATDPDTLHLFSDVPDDHWAAEPLAWAVKNQYLSGYPDLTLRPDAEITRAEVCTILCSIGRKNNLFGEPSPNSALFSDISGHWAQDDILMLIGQGVVVGYPDGTFRPDTPVSRAETVTMLSRFLHRSEKFAQKVSFSDVPETHWAYRYVMNAANGE